MVIATLDDDDNKPLVLPSRSPLRKGTTTVTDPASVAATESNNTACTSPLTITSLEAAAATASTSASASTVKSNNNTSWVPKLVSSRAVLSRGAGMGGIGIGSEASGAGVMEDGISRKVHHRTPPTEHDNRKLFVGGLPTDVTDMEFLEFFQQFGQVVDSVVMVDRLTKRSRGFGFVTFATEAEANALLTNIPGKTGHVLINGKQCEVKASTPKANDGTGRTYQPNHNHQQEGDGSVSVVPGMWRSNPPNVYYNRGYKPRRFVTNNYFNNKQEQQPLDDDSNYKQLDIENEFNGDVNRRNFSPVYSFSSYPTMNNYGRNVLYQPNYPNALFPATAASTGYVYLNDGTDASSPISTSYPPLVPSQGFASTGYFDHYAAAQQYPNHYVNVSPLPYGNQSAAMSSPALVAGPPSLGYDTFNGYYVEGSEGYPSSFDLGEVSYGDDADNEHSGNGGEQFTE